MIDEFASHSLDENLFSSLNIKFSFGISFKHELNDSTSPFEFAFNRQGKIFWNFCNSVGISCLWFTLILIFWEFLLSYGVFGVFGVFLFFFFFYGYDDFPLK